MFVVIRPEFWSIYIGFTHYTQELAFKSVWYNLLMKTLKHFTKLVKYNTLQKWVLNIWPNHFNHTSRLFCPKRGGKKKSISTFAIYFVFNL